MRRSLTFLLENSIFLIAGAVAALVWANLDEAGYHHFVHRELVILLEQHVDLHFLINDVAMAFFFAIAAKEVWEALLPGGSLANPMTAATPLMAVARAIVRTRLPSPPRCSMTGTFWPTGSDR